MEKTLIIDGKAVPFKASGATPRIYRMKFDRDIFADMQNLMDAVSKSGGNLSNANLEVFENIAWVMAYQADKTIAKDPDDWLDQFNVFSIYQILPALVEMWAINNITIEESKKKADGQSGN